MINLNNATLQSILSGYLSPELAAAAVREISAYSLLTESEADFFSDICKAAREIRNIPILPEVLDADGQVNPLADSLEQDDTCGAYHTDGGYIGIDVDMIREVSSWFYYSSGFQDDTEEYTYSVDELLLTIASELARHDMPVPFYPYGILSDEWRYTKYPTEQRIAIRNWRQLSQDLFDELCDKLDWYET